MTQISLKQVANQLNVSPSTIKNWVRFGDLAALDKKSSVFDSVSVDDFQRTLGTTSKHLQRGSNKANSSNTFLPKEYAEDVLLVESVSKIMDYVRSKDFEIKTVLFLAAIKMCVKSGDVVLGGRIFDQEQHTFRRNSIKLLLGEWHQKECKGLKTLYTLIEPRGDDYLGLLYQSLFNEGQKSEQGSYYTPTKLVKDSFTNIEHISTVLDPCCGAGKYLLTAAKHFKLKLCNIYGFDIDEIAVWITKFNLLLHFKKDDFMPNIIKADALRCLSPSLLNNRPSLKVDLVATNPPWGAAKNTKMNILSCVTSGETFSYFIERGLKSLNDNGVLSFILPKSVLNVKVHADIRNYMLDYAIVSIEHLGRPFTRVFSEVVRITIMKKPVQKIRFSLPLSLHHLEFYKAGLGQTLITSLIPM